MQRNPLSLRQRGVAMLEVAIAVLALSLMISALLPMVTAQYKRSSAMKNASATAVAQNALVGYALMNGGLPPPYKFTADASRAVIASPATKADAGVVGALPHDLLGTPISGALAIPLLYDVHPMLRRDLTYSFTVNHYGGNSLTTAGAGTNGNMQQFCRNLNTLAAMETSVRAGAPTFLTSELPKAVLPRTWRDALSANFTTPASNSTGVAAVVVRRNPYTLRKYDRENNVSDAAGGYVKATASLRMYENPASGENESATSTTAAYVGNVSAISYNELRDALVKAGQCGSGPAMCTNNQLYVTIQNNVQVSDGTTTQGAVLQWGQAATGSVVTLYNTLAYGQTLAQCMDAVNLSPAGTDQKLALRTVVNATGPVYAATEKIMVGAGAWLTDTTVLSVPTKQSVVVRCAGTYLTTATELTCTATN